MNKAKSKKRLQTKFLSFKGAFVHFKAEKYEAKGDKRLMLFFISRFAEIYAYDFTSHYGKPTEDFLTLRRQSFDVGE
jgi:hypothetical protein